MKRLIGTLLLAASAAFPALAQDKQGDAHTPKYGGVVVETKAGDLELIAKSDRMLLYVSDHGKPMNLTSASGKLTVFNGKEKTEAPLAMTGERLEARGAFKVGAGTKVLAEVSLNGKPAVSARFTLK